MPSRSFLRSAILLLLALAVSLPPLEARERKNKRSDENADRKPRLRLSVTPGVGFTPVVAVLSGQITGPSPQDANFCHAAVIWTRIDPGQTEEEGLRIREDPVCLHPEEETHVVTSFTKLFELYRPGTYLFKLTVEGKDGRRLQSVFVRVEVLRVQ